MADVPEKNAREQGAGRSRHSTSETALIERTLLRLELHAGGSPLGSVIARAFALALPGALTGRDLRLLQLADEVAATGSLGFRDHARLYLALCACSWAKRPQSTQQRRDAALIAAVALAAISRENMRSAMGVADELTVLAHATAFDERVRAIAGAVSSERPPEELEVERVLRVALAQLESAVSAEARARAASTRQRRASEQAGSP